jgi:hypothetical protein
MSHDKDGERSHRSKRRSRLMREKSQRKSDQMRIVNAESKISAEKLKLDTRIRHLHRQGYSKASLAKRLGVSLRRIELAVNTG